MKTRTVAYIAATTLAALALALGGLFDLARPPELLAAFEHLGYPAYFAIWLGLWKVLGAVAIAVPRFPRLKEWAYAGMFFDLTSASVAHAAAGDPAPEVLVPLLILGVVFASWALRPESRVLPAQGRAPRSSHVPERRVDDGSALAA
jgi:uncharacterized membrane protein YphA (DoxX/SURF4 family)